MDLDLEGKVALVTGGSRGIGRAIGIALAREGVRLVLAARTEADVQRAAREIEKTTGREALAVAGDVTRVADIERMVEAADARFGGVDILVSNAGVPGGIGFGPLADVDDSDVMQDIETKFMGLLRTARAVAPHMQERGWGRIIGIAGLSARYSSSYATERNPEGAFNYSGGPRNLGVIHLMRTLAHELGKDGITANTVLPGATRTEALDQMLERRAEELGKSVEELRQLSASGNAIKRWVDASEIADVVTFIASPRAGSISGEVIPASGGAGMGIFI
ncbi:MAG: SDR family NAD(P)-dependent oxidoreductase [Deltaproteobacteria bacterium]|nr:SDR family NAD(P)-dependent oxidoreductase [Deltaproteobacteria bacterium]MBW2363091.1 SDR family NAD(P)-dependent oxidoreductase [Deltaproteobacteria bacterium]